MGGEYDAFASAADDNGPRSAQEPAISSPATDGEPATASGPRSDTSAGPIDPGDRIVGLDALRGFALLGILAINVWYFSMPLVAGENPLAFGEFTGANYAA